MANSLTTQISEGFASTWALSYASLQCITLLVFLNIDPKLRVPSNDAKNDQMVILMITRVRKCTEVPL
jgi:hypothetical protein